MGAPASQTGLGSAEAPEPHSGLRPTGAIPRAGFTPGPWEWWEGLSYHTIVDVAEQRPIGDALEQADANLIAAAPDLYEALSDLLCYHDVPGRVDAPLKPLLVAAITALGKALGETL